MLTGFLDGKHVQVFMPKGNCNVRVTFLLYIKILKDSHTDMATISAAVCFVESHNDGSAGKGFVRVNNIYAWTCVCVSVRVCVCRWRHLG